MTAAAVPGPEHPNWPWVGLDGPVSTMSPGQHRRWRKKSEALRQRLAKELGRRLTARELIERCDRPAALEVLRIRDVSAAAAAKRVG
jgi:hypothetical protein